MSHCDTDSISVLIGFFKNQSAWIEYCYFYNPRDNSVTSFLLTGGRNKKLISWWYWGETGIPVVYPVRYLQYFIAGQMLTAVISKIAGAGRTPWHRVQILIILCIILYFVSHPVTQCYNTPSLLIQGQNIFRSNRQPWVRLAARVLWGSTHTKTTTTTC